MMAAYLAHDKANVRIWQYQLERPGGQRHGPVWMHKKEAADYLKKLKAGRWPEEKAVLKDDLHYVKVVRFWISMPRNKLRAKGLKVEYVG